MKRIKLLLVLLCLLSVQSQTPVMSQNTNIPVLKDGTYDLYIEVSQWNMVVYDMTNVNQLIEDGYTEDEAMNASLYSGSIGSLQKGTTLNLTLVSLDVQHGFSIDELDIAIALNRPGPEEDIGVPTNVEITLPEDDSVFTAYCHIFCGLGHDDEEHTLDFIIGEGNSAFELDIPLWWMSILSFSLLGISLRTKANKD